MKTLHPIAGGRNVEHDGIVKTATHAASESAVETNQIRDTRACRPIAAETTDMEDLGFSQRTCLVGAQNIHGAKVMNGRKPLDHDLARGHSHRAARQRYSHDHRQEFRREADGQSHSEQKTLKGKLLLDELGQQHEQHQKSGQAENQHAKCMDAALKRRRSNPVLKRGGDGTETGRPSRSDDQHCRLPAYQAGPAEERVEGIDRQCGIAWTATLLHRVWFARQNCFVGQRAAAPEHDAVRRHEIACAKLDEVSGDEIPHRNFTELPVTQHGSLDCNRASQSLDSRLRPLFLKNIERDREQDDEDDHNEALPVTHRTGNQRGNEKNGN